jgi:hypothetical protein
MTDSTTAVGNLIARYAELIDSGDFDGVADLLHDAAVGDGDSTALLTGRDAIRSMFASTTRLYPDGTPGTKHVTTNLILDIDELLDRPAGRAGAAPPADSGRSLPRSVRAPPTRLALHRAALPDRPGRRRQPAHAVQPAHLTATVPRSWRP